MWAQGSLILEGAAMCLMSKVRTLSCVAPATPCMLGMLREHSMVQISLESLLARVPPAWQDVSEPDMCGGLFKN